MSYTITVSEEVYAGLLATAQSRGLTVEALLAEIGCQPGTLTSAHAKELAALAAGGLSPSFPQSFADLIDSTLDYDAIRRDLASKIFHPPLSEIIIEDRG
jgi:hypothetical protein